HFQPSCDTSKIETCSSETLTNTYDNTIRYTDYVLNQTVELLKQYNDDYEVAMMYVSDHGESLGESSFYLHGTPYAIAPKEQTEIPLIFWSSKDFASNHKLNLSCLQNKAQASEYSHDNIFHSLLGLLQVKTAAYDDRLNIFTECQDS
ncbi:MAG: sulfatase-like hydrolase/transferase, partial [Wohlfahrtiimonas sp.]